MPTSGKDHAALLEQLRRENARLRELNARLGSAYAGGPRTPNTDMIMGALASGGDVLGLAEGLAERESERQRNNFNESEA